MNGLLVKGSLIAGVLSLLMGLGSYAVMVMGRTNVSSDHGSLFFLCFSWCMASLFFFNLPGLVHRLSQREKHDE